MSRIGKKEILIPQGVNIEVKNQVVTVSGLKGKLEFKIHPRVEIQIGENKILVKTKGEDKLSQALWGTTRQIIANMIQGVIEGWSKSLEVVGTGYRAALEGEDLIVSCGFSHPVKISPPPGITFSVTENKITVSGADKALVGQVAAKIRQIRPPDSYKGKGIRYLGEKIRLKPGKAAKVGPGISGGKS